MKSETEMVVDLIRDVGVGRLGNFDGCICCEFKVRNVLVEISCGKGLDRGIWVSSGSMDYGDNLDGKADIELLKPIAEEVQRQVQGSDMRGLISFHCSEQGRPVDRTSRAALTTFK